MSYPFPRTRRVIGDAKCKSVPDNNAHPTRLYDGMLLRQSFFRFSASRLRQSLASNISPGQTRLLSTPVSPRVCEGIRRTVNTQAATLDMKRRSLEDLQVLHTFTDELPGDEERKNVTRQVQNAFYSFVTPTQTGTEPYLVANSPEMVEELGLASEEIDRPEFAMIFSGGAQLPGTEGKTWAQCYGGHQFGSWAGQLGDGRAINLGGVTGVSGKQWELQLKGAGRTPYSRMADGRAVMRSSIREFIASEALHHLGIPTTRALCLVGTGDGVIRDMFYSGNIKEEPGAVVCRVSASFIRFGTFQLPASRGGLQTEMVKVLADYVIRHFYPYLKGQENQYTKLLREVSERTGKLVALWQTVGFVHGVLNTDNMSILGETIDYGPFGFLEVFDPNYTPNTTDEASMRYTFRNQPEIGQWNLAQLANALLIADLVDQEKAEEAIGCYAEALTSEYNTRMAAKIGLKSYRKELSVRLLTAMYEDKADFTNTFRALADVSVDDTEGSIPKSILRALPGEVSGDREKEWQELMDQYRSTLRSEGMQESERRRLQNSVNPAYIPRNHLLQNVIAEAEKGNHKAVQDYLELLRCPYEEKPGQEKWTEASPGVIRRGIEMLSCSS